MIVKKDYVLICENLLSDNTAKVTIVNAYDTLFAERVPVMQNALYFVSQVIIEDAEEKDVDTTSFTLRLISPSKEELFSKIVKIKINPANKLQKNVIAANFAGVVLNDFGQYVFTLSFNKKRILQRSLELVKGEPDDAIIRE